jgi:O-antigen/teichoic acid export membrane protein
MGLIFLLVPFAGWGSGIVLIRNVARDRSTFPVYWGNALCTTAVAGCALVLLTVGLGYALLPSLGLQLVLSLAVAELIFGRVADAAGQSFQAVERLAGTALVAIAVCAARVLAALVWLAAAGHHDAGTWGLWYLAATAAAAIAAGVWVSAALGRPAPAPRLALENAGPGFYFALGLQAANIYNDIDKVMLARLSTLGATGIYTAAYRLVTMAFTPVSAFVYTLFARFFRVGTDGVRGTAALAVRVLPVSAAYGLAAAAGLMLAAPIVPVLFGSQYDASAAALRLLAILPLLKSLHYFAADALTGADRQGVRTVIQCAVAALNVLLNLWLIPRYSWSGAAWASVACDASLAVGLWAALAYLWRREVRRVERPLKTVPVWGET